MLANFNNIIIRQLLPIWEEFLLEMPTYVIKPPSVWVIIVALANVIQMCHIHNLYSLKHGVSLLPTCISVVQIKCAQQICCIAKNGYVIGGNVSIFIEEIPPNYII